MSSSDQLVTCPACGARNVGTSQYCAECGTQLDPPADAASTDWREDSGDDASQETAVFVPGARERVIELSEPLPRSTVEPFSPAWSAQQETAEAPATTWSAPVVAPPMPASPGLRGFFLGLLATILIVMVFALWTWSAILDQDARDSIRDFFGFL